MDFPASLQSTTGIVVLAFVLGLFWWMSRRRQRHETVRALPEVGFAYEWVSTPLPKAKKDLLERFPELEATLAASGARDDIHLIRFGLFNMQESVVEAHQMRRPVEIRFPDGVTVLSAVYGESLKRIAAPPEEPPVVDSTRVTLPTFRMDPRSTVIYNLIVRGGAAPLEISGETESHGPLKRVS